MNSRGRLWLVLAIGVGIVGAAFYSQIEWVEQEVDVGHGEEAARNDFYAAELFLHEHGVSTETVTGMALLDDLPSTDDLLLLSASRESLSLRRRDALIDWVGRGGELLIVAHSLYDEEAGSSDDPLLDLLGIFLVASEAEESESKGEQQSDGNDGQDADAGDAADTGEVEAEAEKEVVDALPKTIAELLEKSTEPAACRKEGEGVTIVSTTSGPSLTLELSSLNGLAVYNERLDDAYFSSGAQVVSMPVGEGRVIALTSIRPFVNDRIHCHDHAYFLWFAAGDRQKVWLLHDPDVPSLARLAWTELPGTMAGGFLLCVLVGGMASLRFGVARIEDEQPRRELREHLEASVTFHFRKGGFAGLFVRLRNDLLRRGSPDRERWAERAGISPAEMHDALVAAVPWTRRDILRRVQTMLRLRRTK